MSFLDELDEPDICEASWCPRCKDNPEAIARRREMAKEREAYEASSFRARAR